MKFPAVKALLLVISLVLVSLSFSSSVDVNACANSFSNIVENASCTMLVLKPFEQCFNYTKTLLNQCCDGFCNVKTCTKDIIETNCTTEYKSVNECCQGYSGEDCSPVCNEACTINSYCSAPNTCSCQSGWKGVDCTEVSGLKVTQVQSDAVSLSWSVPENVSNINGYYVHIENEQYSFNKSIFNVINGSKLEGLTPSTSYRACVAPLVIKGEGTSTCLNVQTHSQAPATPPGNVIVLSVRGTTVISWTPPTQLNGPITSYTVYINNTEGSVSKTMEVEGSVTMVRIDGLGSGISVRVSASTTGGEGVVSPYIHHTITLDTSSDVSQPGIDVDAALTLNILSHTSASVSWLPPSPMGAISFYVLCVSRESLSQPVYVWVLRENQSFEHVMDTLVEFVPYKLEVFYGKGDDHYRLLHKRTFFTREGVPIEYPIDVSGYRSTDTSINVTWVIVTPSDARGIVQEYTIRYAKADRSCDYVYNEVNRTVSVQSAGTVMLRSVSVSSNYCVGVSVSTEAGEGPLSPFVFVPVLSQSYFTLKFYGFSSCNNWKRNANTTSELTNILAGVLNRNCSSCIKSDSYFVNPMVNCGDDNQVNYLATIIGTMTHSSSQLVQILMDWSQTDPEVVINGAYLFSNDPGESDPSNEPSSKEDMTIPAIILSVLLIVVLIGWAATIAFSCLLYRKHHRTVEPTNGTPPPVDMKIRQSSEDKLL